METNKKAYIIYWKPYWIFALRHVHTKGIFFIYENKKWQNFDLTVSHSKRVVCDL